MNWWWQIRVVNDSGTLDYSSADSKSDSCEMKYPLYVYAWEWLAILIPVWFQGTDFYDSDSSCKWFWFQGLPKFLIREPILIPAASDSDTSIFPKFLILILIPIPASCDSDSYSNSSKPGIDSNFQSQIWFPESISTMGKMCSIEYIYLEQPI